MLENSYLSFQTVNTAIAKRDSRNLDNVIHTDLEKIASNLVQKYFRINPVHVSFADFYREIRQIVYTAYLETINKWDSSRSSITTYIYIQAKKIIFQTILFPINRRSLHVIVRKKHQYPILIIIKKGEFIKKQNIYFIQSAATISNINNFLNYKGYNANFAANKIEVEISFNDKIIISGITYEYYQTIGINNKELEDVDCQNDNNDTNFDKQLCLVVNKKLKRVLSELSKTQYFVIVYKFGLFGNKTMTNTEIANILGYSNNFVYEIYKIAIKKMRDFAAQCQSSEKPLI